MKKRRIPLALCSAMALLLCACSPAGTETTEEAAPSSQVATAGKSSFADEEHGVHFEYPSYWQARVSAYASMPSVCALGDLENYSALLDILVYTDVIGEKRGRLLMEQMADDFLGREDALREIKESSGFTVNSTEASSSPEEIELGGVVFLRNSYVMDVSYGPIPFRATNSYMFGYVNNRVFIIFTSTETEEGQQELEAVLASLRFTE